MINLYRSFVIAMSLMLLTFCALPQTLYGETRKKAEAEKETPWVEKITFKKLKNKIEQSEAEVTLVHVWATWCPPCVEEFPAIVKIAKRKIARKITCICI
mgnify:CR=1 FL=1